MRPSLRRARPAHLVRHPLNSRVRLLCLLLHISVHVVPQLPNPSWYSECSLLTPEHRAARRVPLPAHVRAPPQQLTAASFACSRSCMARSAMHTAQKGLHSDRWKYTMAKTKQVLTFNGTCANPGENPAHQGHVCP